MIFDKHISIKLANFIDALSLPLGECPCSSLLNTGPDDVFLSVILYIYSITLKREHIRKIFTNMEFII
jgi:hypothetical protein